MYPIARATYASNACFRGVSFARASFNFCFCRVGPPREKNEDVGYKKEKAAKQGRTRGRDGGRLALCYSKYIFLSVLSKTQEATLIILSE